MPFNLGLYLGGSVCGIPFFRELLPVAPSSPGSKPEQNGDNIMGLEINPKKSKWWYGRSR